MNKKWISLFIIFIGIFSIFMNVYAEEDIEDIASSETTGIEQNYQIVINDYADLLTDMEEQQLRNDMAPLTEYGHIAFESINANPTTTEGYARNKYHEMFGTQSGTLFLIDMANRYIYIFSDGENYKYITNSKADIITDNIYRYASNNEYYACAKEAYIEMYAVLSGGKIAQPMKYISNILISMIIAFIVSFLLVIGNARISKASNYKILNGCNISFDVKNVVGQKVGSHRVYNPPSSSSGGGSSGGGGGGGGSSGGGGGHGF